MEKKNCKSCWFFCHGDGRCYYHRLEMDDVYKRNNVPEDRQNDYSFVVKEPDTSFCMYYAFDGLEEWEREACEPEPLMTMEMVLK